ncbi:unnamed protein product [Cladocopium goreaui]|uniref:Uncharacterized protein n=1 Tax=Cladocopium goreaui TaxID=2562237 RepID=A0A9P1FRV7_9DINO|nr:unnamed protein product [Cladocopium goreaui]
MCTVPTEDLRRMEGWLPLNSRPLEPAGHLAQLHAGLSELLSLLLVTEGDERRKARFNEISFSYKKEWARLLTDKDLHYVIAGLVSSGKTTLANSLLAHSVPEEWKGDMLPSAALENTSAVTMFAYNAKMHEQIRARIDTVRLTGHPDGEASSYESHADPSSMTLSSMKELQEKIPSLLRKLTGTKDAFKRLVVEIPYLLNVVPGIHEKIFGIHPSEVLVDTPGLDSPGLKEHLASILAEKCFLYCFIVNVESASPFGNHGFELLQFLTRNVEMMFPPVIIFTKFKQLEETSRGTTWKMANPGGLTGRLKDLVNLTLDKLEEAGIPHCPFFADVDALWASRDFDELPEFKEEIQAAQDGLSEFFKALVCLGRSIATPLHQCRLLELQNQTTQTIINEIHQEDGQRLLEGEDLDDLKKLGEKLKQDFSENVDNYLHVQWTDRGILQYEPQKPFSRDTCAISRMPAEFRKVFQSYKERNPKVENKGEAVRAIVEETNKQVLSLIADDLSKYEADALDRFKVTLWKKMGTKDMDLKQHLEFSFWQYLVGGGLGTGAICAGVAAGEAAFAAGAAAYFTGAAALVGTGVGALGLVLCAAFFCKDLWGGWTWEGGEKASWEALLDACNKNCPKIRDFVKKGFNKKVDEILQKIEAHRTVPSPETSECQAAKIQTSAKKSYKHVAKQLQEILKGKKERWLGKKVAPPSKLEQICKEVLEDRHQKANRFTLNMGSMSG